MPPKPHRVGRLLAQVLVGIALLGLVLFLAGADAVARTLQTVDPEWFLAGALAWHVLAILIAFRLQQLLGGLGSRVPLRHLYLANQSAMLLSDFTPGRIGYFTLTPYLHARWGVAPFKSMASMVGVQAADFVLKGLVAAIGIAVLVSGTAMEATIRLLFVSAAFAFLLLSAGLAAFAWGGRTRLVKRMLGVFPLGRQLVAYLRGATAQLRLVRAFLPQVLAVSLVGLLVVGTQWWLVGRSIGIDRGLLLMLVLQPAVSVLSFVPLGVAGLGLQEAGLVLIMMVFGLSPAQAVSFALLVRVNALVGELPGLLPLARRHWFGR